MSDSLTGVAIGAVLGFVGGWALKYVGPKSKLVYWFTHNSFSQIPQPGSKNTFNLFTSSVTVQNMGRRRATNVELVFTSPPNHYTLTPTRPHAQRTTPQGQHVINIPTLGHNEWFTLEVIGFGTAPGLLHLRSDDGAAELVPMMPQRIWPRWVNWSSVILVLTGAAFILYWGLRGLRHLAQLLGMIQ